MPTPSWLWLIIYIQRRKFEKAWRIFRATKIGKKQNLTTFRNDVNNTEYFKKLKTIPIRCSVQWQKHSLFNRLSNHFLHTHIYLNFNLKRLLVIWNSFLNKTCSCCSKNCIMCKILFVSSIIRFKTKRKKRVSGRELTAGFWRHCSITFTIILLTKCKDFWAYEGNSKGLSKNRAIYDYDLKHKTIPKCLVWC